MYTLDSFKKMTTSQLYDVDTEKLTPELFNAWEDAFMDSGLDREALSASTDNPIAFVIESYIG